MSVDLSNYVDSLKREVSPPGVDDFPAAVDSEWIGNLADAFWEARLDGLLATFTCDENGIVTPLVTQSPPLPDMGRDMVQLVVLYASFRILRNTLRGLRTEFSASAGPVHFQYQQSANLLTELIKDLINRRDIILARLSDLGTAPVYVIDGILARDDALRYGDITFVASGNYLPDWGAYH